MKTLRKSPFEQNISLKKGVRNLFLCFQSCFLKGFSRKHLRAKKNKQGDKQFLLSCPNQHVQMLKLTLSSNEESVHGHIQYAIGAVFQYFKGCNFYSRQELIDFRFFKVFMRLKSIRRRLVDDDIINDQIRGCSHKTYRQILLLHNSLFSSVLLSLARYISNRFLLVLDQIKIKQHSKYYSETVGYYSGAVGFSH